MNDDKETVERAKELLVYGPVGLALFLRDNAPQFMRMFVDRGRTELDQRRRAAGEQIDHVRSLGESAATDGGPEVLRMLSTALAALREKAEEALVALGVTDADASLATEVTEDVAGFESGTVAWNRDRADLAIPGYDDLSASQIVDRLDHLSSVDLVAIRDYEAAHRARNTILGKIEQLTRGS